MPGYHDKNWEVVPFASTLKHTYWGHARDGPYSVVWSQALAPTGSNGTKAYFSGVVAEGGKFAELSCAADAVVVRPWGANDTYPPTVSTGPPQGLAIAFDLGPWGGGVLRLNVTRELTVADSGYYQRFIGSVKGGLSSCEDEYEGTAIYEQFKVIGL